MHRSQSKIGHPQSLHIFGSTEYLTRDWQSCTHASARKILTPCSIRWSKLEAAHIITSSFQIVRGKFQTGKGQPGMEQCKHAFRKRQCYYTVHGQSLTRRINVQKQSRQVKNRGRKKNFLKRKRKNYIEQFSLFLLGPNPNHSILMKCRAVPHLYGAQC